MPIIDMQRTGENIKHLRQQKNLTVRELQDIMGFEIRRVLGSSPSTQTKYGAVVEWLMTTNVNYTETVFYRDDHKDWNSYCLQVYEQGNDTHIGLTVFKLSSEGKFSRIELITDSQLYSMKLAK